MRSFYIPTLDGWRAIAVSLIIGAHAVPALATQDNVIAKSLTTLFWHAGYGVDIFFAISGYLICTLLLKERELTTSISLHRFYARRAFRILPPLVMYLSVLLVLRSSGVLPEVRLTEIVSSLLFVRNYMPADGTWYTGHFWSLAIEEHFYLVLPLMLAVLVPRRALFAVLTLALASVWIRWAEFEFDMFPDFEQRTFRTESRLDALMCGAAWALMLQRAELRELITKYSTLPVLLVLLVATIWALHTFPSQPVRRTIVAWMMPVFVTHTTLRPGELLGRLLELPPVRWLGRLSYSLYVWQMMFLVPAARPLGVFQSYPTALFMSLGCAVLSYYVIERPLIRLGHRLAAAPMARPSMVDLQVASAE